jgi:hypothetical protein
VLLCPYLPLTVGSRDINIVSAICPHLPSIEGSQPYIAPLYRLLAVFDREALPNTVLLGPAVNQRPLCSPLLVRIPDVYANHDTLPVRPPFRPAV